MTPDDLSSKMGLHNSNAVSLHYMLLKIWPRFREKLQMRRRTSLFHDTYLENDFGEAV